MLKSRNKVIGITMGDPQGIGGEIIAKALSRPDLVSQGHFIIFGDGRRLKKLLAKSYRRVSVVDVDYKDPGEGALKFLDTAIAFIRGGLVDALVTAPLSKERVARFYPGFHGHTEYLAQAFGVKHVEMMFVTKHLKTVIVTRHEALKDIPKLITPSAVYKAIALTHESLVGCFKINKPSIAVLGLNPHAGENGLMGKEEIRAIIPAITKAVKNGWNVKGPFAADTFFVHGHAKTPTRPLTKPYDAVIAMYHDQGLIPIKTLYFNEVVNTTIGLPFLRTCPAHGTAFDIAGKNMANPSSMMASIKLALGA